MSVLTNANGAQREVSGLYAGVNGAVRRIFATKDTMEYLIIGDTQGGTEISVPSMPDFFFPMSYKEDNIMSEENTDLPEKFYNDSGQGPLYIRYSDTKITIVPPRNKIWLRYVVGKYKK